VEPIVRVFEETVAIVLGLLRPAVKSVRENTGLAALSVVLAFGLWIFVTDTENPTNVRVVPEDIPVQAIHVPADVALADVLPPVRARVRVADNVFESLSAADFEATVDLQGLTVGTYDLAVQVRPLTSRGGLRVDDVLPQRITVRLSEQISKSVPVSIDTQGSPPSGYTTGSPQTKQTTTLVSGPQDKVDQVTQAVAVLNVNGRTEPVDQAVRLVPRDSRGFLVVGVELDPPLIDVSLDVQQQLFSRSLAVSADVTGTPADGYNVVAVSVNPASVTVRGLESFIQSALTIKTRPVDIQDSTGDEVRSVSLDVPADVSVTGGIKVVTVTVKIEPASGQAVFLVPVNPVGLGDGLSIRGALPSVQVTLRGTLPGLRDVTPADIVASVDIKDKDAGIYRVTVKVTAPADLQVLSVSPVEVQLTLEKK